MAEFKEQQHNNALVLNFAKWLLGVGSGDLIAMVEAPPQSSFMIGRQFRGSSLICSVYIQMYNIHVWGRDWKNVSIKIFHLKLIPVNGQA